MSKEIWKKYKNTNYLVSNKGRIKGPLKILTPNVVKKRLMVTIHKKAVYVHRAVCETFHKRRPKGATWVKHNDGNYYNNHAENLSWTKPADRLTGRTWHVK